MIIYCCFRFAQATARHGKHYFVLLIITDGMVTDIDKSIDAIVALSQLPMSVVIVGVGDNDLSEKYKIFDGTYLKSSSGQLAERCNVQVNNRYLCSRMHFYLVFFLWSSTTIGNR